MLFRIFLNIHLRQPKLQNSFAIRPRISFLTSDFLPPKMIKSFLKNCMNPTRTPTSMSSVVVVAKKRSWEEPGAQVKHTRRTLQHLDVNQKIEEGQSDSARKLLRGNSDTTRDLGDPFNDPQSRRQQPSIMSKSGIGRHRHRKIPVPVGHGRRDTNSRSATVQPHQKKNKRRSRPDLYRPSSR